MNKKSGARYGLFVITPLRKIELRAEAKFKEEPIDDEVRERIRVLKRNERNERDNDVMI